MVLPEAYSLVSRGYLTCVSLRGLLVGFGLVSVYSVLLLWFFGSSGLVDTCSCVRLRRLHGYALCVWQSLVCWSCLCLARQWIHVYVSLQRLLGYVKVYSECFASIYGGILHEFPSLFCKVDLRILRSIHASRSCDAPGLFPRPLVSHSHLFGVRLWCTRLRIFLGDHSQKRYRILCCLVRQGYVFASVFVAVEVPLVSVSQQRQVRTVQTVLSVPTRLGSCPLLLMTGVWFRLC